jgi:uncharacterized protein YndB with AHSA1/START domain
MTATGDYTKQIHIGATPEKVFDTLTTAAEFTSWWAPAAGSAAEAGELHITFDGIEDPLVLQVKQATRSSTVIWDVESCAFLPDWVGTTAAFTLSPASAGGCDLEFRHEGLSPQLECYDMCQAGWDQYLPSLRDYVETGTGDPFSRARLGRRADA